MEKLLATQYNIIQHQKVQTISVRDLYTFLEVKTEFRKWITNCIKELSFREDVDFVLSTKNYQTPHVEILLKIMLSL
ncbi:antA/AntB antirepressor family protein [Bartonella sp. CL434QHHD]|uniref:antA/AntB antirepressor family protein n=1 Tax=Bartonella sp. CL434QHHD TaxID=3243529 RepID=UPI0035CFF258